MEKYLQVRFISPGTCDFTVRADEFTISPLPAHVVVTAIVHGHIRALPTFGRIELYMQDDLIETFRYSDISGWFQGRPEDNRTKIRINCRRLPSANNRPCWPA